MNAAWKTLALATLSPGALLLMGCDPTVADDAVEIGAGYVSTCLGHDGEEGEPIYGYNTFEISGEVVSDGAFVEPDSEVHRCFREDRALTICDDDGVIWTLGYQVQDEDGEDITAALDVTPGQQVDLFFASLQDFGVISGFVLRDEGGVVAVIEDGTWDSALAPTGSADPIDEFAVSTGDVLLTEDSGCGEVEHRELVFSGAGEGDSEVSLAPGASGEFTVDGAALTASALRSYDYTGTVTCTDTAGATVWTVWR